MDCKVPEACCFRAFVGELARACVIVAFGLLVLMTSCGTWGCSRVMTSLSKFVLPIGFKNLSPPPIRFDCPPAKMRPRQLMFGLGVVNVEVLDEACFTDGFLRR